MNPTNGTQFDLLRFVNTGTATTQPQENLFNLQKFSQPMNPITPATPVKTQSQFGLEKLSTPAPTAQKVSTSLWDKVKNFTKGIVGADVGQAIGEEDFNNTVVGIAANTLFGMPKATVDLVTNTAQMFKQVMTEPSPEQQAYEKQYFPEQPDNLLGKLVTPGQTTAKYVTRAVNPLFLPWAKDYAESKVGNEMADKVLSGDLPYSAFEDYVKNTEVFGKKTSQIIGDSALAALSLPLPFNLGAGLTTNTIRGAVIQGAKGGLEMVVPFSVAQILSDDVTDPQIMAQIFATNSLALPILGAITSGTIPVTKEMFDRAVKIKEIYDTIPNKQAGFIQNPLFEESKPEGGFRPVEVKPKEKINPITETPKIYYHVTSPEASAKIEVEGFKPYKNNKSLFTGISFSDNKVASDRYLKSGRFGTSQGEYNINGKIYDLVGEVQDMDAGIIKALKEFGIFNKEKHIFGEKYLGAGSPNPQATIDLRRILKENGYVGVRLGIDGEVSVWNNKDITKVKKESSRVTAISKEEIKVEETTIEPTPRGDMKERGFITSAKEAVPEATKIAGQYIPRATDPLSVKAKNLIAEDFDTAWNLAKKGTDESAVATASELLKHLNELAQKTEDKIMKDSYYAKAAEVANTIAPKLTELGRAVQAASILGRLTPEGQVKFAASEIARYNESLPLNKRIPELSKENASHILTEMRAINEMPDGTPKAKRFQELQHYITDLVPTPLLKKIITVWKSGLLTGIKTHGLNIFSNLSHAGTEILKDIPAAIVDKVISLITGKRTTTFTLGGAGEGAKTGLTKGLDYLKTGFDERNIGTKLDYNRINMGKGTLAQALQAYTEAIFRVLGTEDQPFYYAAKLRSLYEQAKVEAINKGLKGEEAQTFIDNLMQNPNDEMIKYASLDAETAVFQNVTALSKAAKHVQVMFGGLGEIVVPFARTPSAVAMQVLNYSPVGVVKTIVENFGKGNFDQRVFSKGMGRALTGTAVLWMGTELYKKGKLSLGKPKNEDEKKLWELEGRVPNAIKVGNKWRSIQILGPAGNVLLIGGYFQQNFNKEGSPSQAMIDTLAGMYQSFTQQTFLTGISNFIDAISDPQRSAKYVVSSTLASIVPTLLSDIARATDTRERRAETILDSFKLRVPGLRETLEPQVTTLGKERHTVGNPLEIMIDPTRPSKEITSPVIREIRRLWEAGYKVSPTLLGDKAGYSALTPEENTALWERAGEITNEKLNSLLNLPAYQSVDDNTKAKLVDAVVAETKLVARAEAVINATKDLTGDAKTVKLSELKKSGLMTKDVFNRYLELQ